MTTKKTTDLSSEVYNALHEATREWDRSHSLEKHPRLRHLVARDPHVLAVTRMLEILMRNCSFTKMNGHSSAVVDPVLAEDLTSYDESAAKDAGTDDYRLRSTYIYAFRCERWPGFSIVEIKDVVS